MSGRRLWGLIRVSLGGNFGLDLGIRKLYIRIAHRIQFNRSNGQYWGGGVHSKTPSTCSFQHEAQYSHPPQRSGQTSESSQFSTTLPSPVGGGGRASSSSFFLQRSPQPSRRQRPTSIQTSLPLRILRGPKNHSRALDPNGVSPLASPIDTTQFDGDPLGLSPTSSKRLPQ